MDASFASDSLTPQDAEDGWAGLWVLHMGLGWDA